VFTALLDHLETIPALHLGTHPRWHLIREDVAARRPGLLARYEDEVDAIVCAHLAWLWDQHPDTLHVYGTVHDGYIVAPPTHRPVTPTPASPDRRGRSAPARAPFPQPSGPDNVRATPNRTAGRLQADAVDVRAWIIVSIAQGTAPVTYGEVAVHVGRIPHGLGPLLDEVERLCAQRGEPNLAVLVVNKTTREPIKCARRGHDWSSEQDRCLRREWNSDLSLVIRLSPDPPLRWLSDGVP